jgi:hypothetical protein
VVWTPGWLRCNQFGDADQVIGDQIEEEVGGDATDAAMFGLAHGSVLLAPTEDALAITLVSTSGCAMLSRTAIQSTKCAQG